MARIWPFLQKEEGRTTDFSYGGVLMWVDFFNYDYAIVDDTLFIRGVVEDNRDIPAFSLPVGKLKFHEALKLIREYCEEQGITPEFSAVPEYALPEIEKCNPVKIEPLDHWSDYLYDARQLATLQGKKMSKKRNHVNQFVAHYPDWSYESLTATNAGAVLEFMKHYKEEADDGFMSREENRLAEGLIKMIAEGDGVLRGGVLYNAPGEICAISIGDVKGDTLYVHVEKALREVIGSYEMINKEFAAHQVSENPQILYINREDDGGDEGLRYAKESYHPVDLLKKYNIIF